MGLLDKALKEKSTLSTTQTSGLLMRALQLKTNGDSRAESPCQVEKKNGDAEGKLRDRSASPVSTDIRENLPPEAVSFIRASINQSRSVLLIKLHFKYMKDFPGVFQATLRALTSFLSDRSVIFSNEEQTIGILFAFTNIDQELLVHQIRNIIRINQEHGEQDFSYTVDCIFDIQTQ